MSDWIVIFRDAVPAVAGVTVYDKGRTDVLGRYVIAKVMKVKGRTLTKQSYRCQRPAAERLAKKFLSQRAEKSGVTYVPGAGAGTLGYKPVS